ncbi:MAG: sigma-70 family RNA polymerase sigma factor, partial [bacterium]|nr:sigma-70 family RNA polymerase sigma factor [bacterium]
VRNLARRRREQSADSGDFERAQDREQGPEERFDDIWKEEHLKHCLRLVRAEVEPTTFQVFHRYVLEECSVEDVCAELGVTPNQVYKAKWRLTQRVSEKMEELLEGSE